MASDHAAIAVQGSPVQGTRCSATSSKAWLSEASTLRKSKCQPPSAAAAPGWTTKRCPAYSSVTRTGLVFGSIGQSRQGTAVARSIASA